MLQLQGFPSAATHGYAVLMYAYHRRAQPWPSPSPVLHSSSPFLCSVRPVTVTVSQSRTRMAAPRARTRSKTDHSRPVLKIAPFTQFKCVSLLSARLWLVPPPLATFSMAPLPTPQGPLSPAADSPVGPSLLFFFSSLDSMEIRRACVSLRGPVLVARLPNLKTRFSSVCRLADLV